MSDAKPRINLYTVGGAVQAGGGLYLPRKADDELLQLCRTGSFSYVLTPRQMGKTSLMVRTAERLGEEGVQSVIIDLTQIGVQVTIEAWYLGLLTSIEDQLMLKTNAVEWWKEREHQGMTQRLADFFKDVLLKEVEGSVVVFVDEIDTTLSLSFTDDFYAAIRYFFNARAHTPELKRLSFVLIGVATPGDLVRDPQRTPFNIGHRVDLTDFTPEEARPLADGLGLPVEESRQVLGWVMEWTGGHPYLTQRLCRAVAEEKRENWTREDVERLTSSIFFGEMSEKDHNLQFVRDMLTKRAPDKAGVLTTYREVLRNRRPVLDEEQSIIKSHLKLSGVVYRRKGALQVRNPIYGKVFNDHWVSEHLPVNWAKRLQRIAAALAVLVLLGLIPLSIYAFAKKRAAEAQAHYAEVQRQEAVKQRENAFAAQQDAERQREKAETAAEQQRIAREEEQKQRQIAEDERSRAEQEAQRANKQSALAEKRRQDAVDLRLEADRLRQVAFGGQLGALAEVTRNQQSDLLQRSALIARESILQSPSAPPLVGYQALNQALSLMPLPLTQFSTEARVLAAAFSPDQKSLVVLTDDSQATATGMSETVYVLDPNNGYKEIPGLKRRVLSGGSYYSSDLTHMATVNGSKVSVVNLVSGSEQSFTVPEDAKDFTLGSDGKYFAYLDEETQTIHVRDVSEGKDVFVLKVEGQSRVVGLSPTGKYLLALMNIQSTRAGERWTLAAWDIAAQREVKRIVNTTAEWLLFSPDDQYLIEKTANSEDLVIRRTKDFAEAVATVKNPGNLIFTFSPNSELLAVVDRENVLRVLEMDGGELLASLKQDSVVMDVTFSPDGRYLAARSSTRMARVWDLRADFNEVTRLLTSTVLLDFNFGPGGRLVTANASGDIQVWEPQSDQDFIHKTIVEDAGRAILTPDGRYLAEAHSGTSFSFKVWDTATPGKDPLDSIEFKGVASGFDLSPDGKYVAVTFDDAIRVWEVAGARQPREIKLDYVATEVAISAGGKYVATIMHDKPNSKVHVWEVATGKTIATIENKDDTSVLVFSPDGEYFASGDRTIKVLRLADRQMLPPITLERDKVGVMAFSSQSKYLAMAGSELKVWVRETGRVVTLSDEKFINTLAFGGNERYLATVTDGNAAEVWDIDTALKATTDARIASFRHDNGIYALALTRNGDHLVTISQGNYARIWDVRNRREAARVPYRSAEVGQDYVAFTGENDKYLVATRTDGAAVIWIWQPNDLVQATCSRLTAEKLTDVPWGEYLDSELLNKLTILGKCQGDK